MPKTGTSASSNAATAALAYGTMAGSPGPLARKTPSGCRASTASAGVASGDAGHAVAAQERIEVLVGAPVAVAAGEVAHDHAATEGSARLVVGRRHAVVADVRVREGDDLSGVRGVGDDLLISRQHGVE